MTDQPLPRKAIPSDENPAEVTLRDLRDLETSEVLKKLGSDSLENLVVACSINRLALAIQNLPEYAGHELVLACIRIDL